MSTVVCLQNICKFDIYKQPLSHSLVATVFFRLVLGRLIQSVLGALLLKTAAISVNIRMRVNQNSDVSGCNTKAMS